MNYLRKIICIVLCFSMLLGIGTIPASAAETEPVEMESEESSPVTLPVEETEATETTEPVTETTEETVETTEGEEETAPNEEITPEETEAEEETEPTETAEEDTAMFAHSSSMCFGADEYTEHIHQVPLYLQTDYPDVRYGSGTVATGGCTITSLAMVASYLSGNEYRPDALARRFNSYEGSSIEKMEAAADYLELPYDKTENWEELMDGMRRGRIALILLNSESPFTSSQHVVVLKGITREDRILINDPYGPNYEREELSAGYEEGFPPEMVSAGFSGAWIFHGNTGIESSADLESLNEVPLYLQTDYNTNPFQESIQMATAVLY